MATFQRKRKVASALRKHARTMKDWVNPTSKVTKFRASAANSFLLGVMFDRGIPYEKAWEAGEWINDSLGDPKDPAVLWRNLATIEKKRLVGFLRYGYGGKSFHRHYKTFARLLKEAAKNILENYSGDPRKIWNSQRSIPIVRDRLEELPGIGLALSRMAVLMLARNYGLLGGKGALSQLDIKPDVHVMRVFKRSGLISKSDKEIDAIMTARKLSPKFPGQLDAPAWEIGRKWCKARKKLCSECPIHAECPKLN